MRSFKLNISTADVVKRRLSLISRVVVVKYFSLILLRKNTYGLKALNIQIDITNCELQTSSNAKKKKTNKKKKKKKKTVIGISDKIRYTLRKHAHAIYGKSFGCKNENFHWKKFDIFLIFAQNIDCGYTLEPPRRGGSNEYPQSMFWSKNKKNRFTPAYPSFSI